MIDKVNSLSEKDLRVQLKSCCSSTKWAESLLQERPFASREDFLEKGESIWKALDHSDVMEAFDGHPKIGDTKQDEPQFKAGKSFSQKEQQGVAGASEELLETMRELNAQYEQRFGYIYIVFASGKSLTQMVSIIKERLENGADDELEVAKNEQFKITKNRMEKLL